MRARQFNVLFILTALIAIGAVVQDVRFDLSLAHERVAALTMEQQFASIETALADWRATQAGYVATGQSPSYWIKRGSERSAEIEATLANLQTETENAEVRTQYEAAATALTDIKNIDAHARDFALSDRRFEASDLIFVDASGPTQRLLDALGAARSAERQSSQARIVSTRWFRLGLNAVAVGCLLGAVLLFRKQTRQAESEAADAKAAAQDPSASEGIVSPARPMTVNLGAAAELCVDLGRVADGREVPALLERLAPVLGAKGIVLWVADRDGASLRPLLTLGYPERMIERLGMLPADSDNVTSLAFRSMRSQAVNGAAPSSPGAIAVPLVTAAGCIGVLSAEVAKTRPDQDTLAIARMVGAQFAALLSPADPLPEARTAHV